MSIQVLKQEEVKLWGMFKLKQRLMKIILCQKNVDGAENTRSIYLQIDEPHDGRSGQDFKDSYGSMVDK